VPAPTDGVDDGDVEDDDDVDDDGEAEDDGELEDEAPDGDADTELNVIPSLPPI
jgi:hypothetical protein